MSENINNPKDIFDYKYSYSPTNLEVLSLSNALDKVREKVAPQRFKLAARNIVKELELGNDDKVLELGSGLGLLGQEVQNEAGGNIEYFGVELAYNPARESKDKITAPTQADAVNLPFADNSFDAIITTDVLEHIPDAENALSEIHRVLKPGKKAFLVIADPSEGRFDYVPDHIDRTGTGSDVNFWEEKLESKGFDIKSKVSEKYRNRDWRKIFNLPFLVKFKDKPGLACAFNPTNRPGTYIVEKPSNS